MTAPVTRYKVIDTALCIGDSVFEGEEIVVLSSDYERLEQERDTLRAQVEAMQSDKAAIDLLNQYIVTAEHPVSGKTAICADSGTLRDCMAVALQAKLCQHLPIGWHSDITYCELCGEKL